MTRLLTQFKVGAILTLFKPFPGQQNNGRTNLQFGPRARRKANKPCTPCFVGGETEPGILTTLRSNAERGFLFPAPVIRASREQDALNRCYGCNGHTAPETSAVSLWAFIMQQARVRWHQTPLRPVKLKENIQPLKSSAVAVFLLTLKIYLNRQELPKWGSGGGISSFSFSFYNHEAH